MEIFLVKVIIYKNKISPSIFYLYIVYDLKSIIYTLFMHHKDIGSMVKNMPLYDRKCQCPFPLFFLPQRKKKKSKKREDSIQKLIAKLQMKKSHFSVHGVFRILCLQIFQNRTNLDKNLKRSFVFYSSDSESRQYRVKWNMYKLQEQVSFMNNYIRYFCLYFVSIFLFK